MLNSWSQLLSYMAHTQASAWFPGAHKRKANRQSSPVSLPTTHFPLAHVELGVWVKFHLHVFYSILSYWSHIQPVRFPENQTDWIWTPISLTKGTLTNFLTWTSLNVPFSKMDNTNNCLLYSCKEMVWIKDLPHSRYLNNGRYDFW